MILVLLVAEWMVLTGTGSFAGILGFLGVMVHSLMSGIFPALLLVASRRKGELVPGVSYRALGHPLIIGGIYLLFLSNLFLHGLVIWEHPLQRAGGVLVGLLMLVVTAAMIRRGAFGPRVVVELRQDLGAPDGHTWRSWLVASRRTRRFGCAMTTASVRSRVRPVISRISPRSALSRSTCVREEPGS